MSENAQTILTGVMLVLMIGTLALGRFSADIVMMGVLLVLLIGGVIAPDEAIAGFANQGLITVAMLYVVAAAMKETGAMARITSVLLGRPKDERSAQIKLTLPVAAMSAFINNTPIVAMFLPTLDGVARRCRIAPSKLYMPLSFASILGGVCTLIGTSTNVIVAGLLSENPITSDGGPATVDNPALGFSMFSLAKVGLPIALFGLAYILIFGRKLLPDRANPIDQAESQGHGYHAALKVSPGCPIIGKTVEAANLRSLPGLFLARIERSDDSVIAVSPREIIEAEDVLVFVGKLDSVVELQQIKGLVPSTADAHEHDDEAANGNSYRPNLRIVEAVVSNNSSLV
ncbi:MAG: SLC13 family permease, partial [bacterium]|nr:SLC13 family permease [bacterium]